jgi:tRNA(fMet)-specific endonuclease VapC
LKYILDTDICIFAIKHRMGVLRRLLQESPDDVAVSTMTQAELRFGAMKSSQAEKAMTLVEAFLEPLTILAELGLAKVMKVLHVIRRYGGSAASAH